jgi:DNA polymerase-1
VASVAFLKWPHDQGARRAGSRSAAGAAAATGGAATRRADAAILRISARAKIRSLNASLLRRMPAPAGRPERPSPPRRPSIMPRSAARPPFRYPSPVARLLLADGSSQIYRTYHALARTNTQLTTKDGVPTGALLSFLAVLRKAIKRHQPTHVAVTFDRPGRNFRHERFPGYKATRDAAPEDLVLQLRLAHDALAALGIPVVELDGWEADDVIATLVKRARDEGAEVVVLTSDKDLLQLVRPGVVLHHGHRDEVMDEAGAESYFGVRPDRVADVLAIEGDVTDNIPGVKGIGEKGARLLVQHYGSIDEILASTKRIAEDETLGRTRKRMAALLEEHADAARLARELVGLREDAPVREDIASFAVREPDRARCTELFTRLELLKLLSELDLDTAAAEARTAAAQPLESAGSRGFTLTVAESPADVGALIRAAREAGGVAISLRAEGGTSLRAEGDLAGAALSSAPGSAAWIPLGGGRAGALESVRALLADPAVAVSGQDLKQDLQLLARAGITVAHPAFDAHLASFVLDPSRRRHDIGTLAADHLGYRLADAIVAAEAEEPTAASDDESPADEAAAGDAREDGQLFEAPAAATPRRTKAPVPPLTPAQVAERAEVVARLRDAMRPKLEAAGLAKVYDTIDLPVVPILAAMERTGVRVDPSALDELRVEMRARLEELTGECFRHAGREFNIGSPKQLAEVLYDELGLRPRARTSKTGARSTAVDVLEQLADDHPICRSVLQHRELSKLVGTYVDVLPRLVDPATGRVHARWHQAVAETGRLSSSDPNLQNIPIRSELGRRIRKAFVAEPGMALAGADYSQVELRIMAHLSEDEALCEAFARGEDIHRATAAKMFGILPDLVTGEMRNRAKVINFGLLYGMTAHGVATRLGCSRAEAQHLIDGYFGAYPRMRATIERLIEETRQDPRHEARTIFGRTRPLPEIVSRNAGRRAFSERAAVNTVVQGTAADLMKLAMIAVHERLAKDHPEARVILQVHDELVVEAPEAEARDVLAAMIAAMEGVHRLRAPLEAVGTVGATWYDLK